MDPDSFDHLPSASYKPDMAAEIDGDEPTDRELFWHVLGHALHRLLAWQLGAAESYESIGRRTVALCADMSPELVEGESQSGLAAKLGGERASLSFWKRDFEKTFQVHFRPGKTKHAQVAYHQARVRSLQARAVARQQEDERLRAALAVSEVKPAAPKALAHGTLFEN